ncbi:hypothetical protein [Rosenbergiella epipactidis]|uniref:hypothetical protein n=1 Tax=Rosenbergiella epipactidis TaxID=1544694 RepID=UPI003BAA7997
MTVLYQGMNRNTGLGISDTDHISQSIRDILLMLVSSRVIRRENTRCMRAFLYPH